MKDVRWRLFATCWLICSLHFATNIVREHYPAFTLIDHGHVFLDEYAGFHPDIFEHANGHHVIGNQVTGSVPAALALLPFKPVLDWLGRRGAASAADTPPRADPEDFAYETPHKNRRAFFEKVNERGLAIKFGAAAAITTVFCMAPLTAAFAVVCFNLFVGIGLGTRRSLWLALLAVFGTPMFYRTGYLNHNLFFALAVFAAFLCLRPLPDPAAGLGGRHAFWGGVFAGLTVALDYAGVVTLGLFALYHLWRQWQAAGGSQSTAQPAAGGGTVARAIEAVRRSVPFVAGTVPPILFLWATQWWTYGHPFKPGQFWMPDQNIYVGEGVRGITLPDLELFFLNLFDLDWGLFTFAPLLLLALWPLVAALRGEIVGSRTPVVSREETLFIGTLSLAFMLFCSINQYSRLQWNTGFRYLLPLVPLLFLVAVGPLLRMKRAVALTIGGLAMLHTWVLSMVRHTPPSRGDAQAVPESWRVVLTEGLQLPWLNVLRTTPTIDHPVVDAVWLPYLLFGLLAVAVAALWVGPLGVDLDDP